MNNELERRRIAALLINALVDNHVRLSPITLMLACITMMREMIDGVLRTQGYDWVKPPELVAFEVAWDNFDDAVRHLMEKRA